MEVLPVLESQKLTVSAHHMGHLEKLSREHRIPVEEVLARYLSALNKQWCNECWQIVSGGWSK